MSEKNKVIIPTPEEIRKAHELSEEQIKQSRIDLKKQE